MTPGLWPVIAALLGGIGIGASIALPIIDRRLRRARHAVQQAWNPRNHRR